MFYEEVGSMCTMKQVTIAGWGNQQNDIGTSRDDSDQPRHLPSLIRLFIT